MPRFEECLSHWRLSRQLDFSQDCRPPSLCPVSDGIPPRPALFGGPRVVTLARWIFAKAFWSRLECGSKAVSSRGYETANESVVFLARHKNASGASEWNYPLLCKVQTLLSALQRCWWQRAIELSVRCSCIQMYMLIGNGTVSRVTIVNDFLYVLYYVKVFYINFNKEDYHKNIFRKKQYMNEFKMKYKRLVPYLC